jgi:hypothetical protein
MVFWFAFGSKRPSGQKAGRFEAIERQFARLARRKALAVLTVGILVVLLRVSLIPILGIPEPQVHDEFSYLLAGKTYAMGRMTNPSLPYPLWIHFESFHIIQQPTYMSMYPPAQGLVLAASVVLGLHPWFSVLFITAVMCATMCWMLQGWVPPTWAFFGGLLAAARLGILSYWMNSYFATSICAFGGLLVLGALPRLRKHLRVRDSLLMALGLVVLANSRPYEGFVFSLSALGYLGCWMFHDRPPLGKVIARFIVPVSLVLLIAGLSMCYYFWRVTGNPFRMPYQVNRETYAVAPYFIWQKLQPEPVYHHEEMRIFYTQWELGGFLQTQTMTGLMLHTLRKVAGRWICYLGLPLTIPLLACPCILRDRKMRFFLIAGAIFFLGTFFETWTLNHYVAPAIGLLYVVLVQCMRHLRLWRWRGSATGLTLVRSIAVVCAFVIVLRVTAIASHAPAELPWPLGNLKRARLLKKLDSTPGQHLVIVHPDEPEIQFQECVYNEPDINSAKVVWARDMGRENNQDLLQYFHGRHIWFLEVGPDGPLALSPYPDQEPSN